MRVQVKMVEEKGAFRGIDRQTDRQTNTLAERRTNRYMKQAFREKAGQLDRQSDR